MKPAKLARALASLEAGELRAHKAAAVLSALPPREAVLVLGQLIRRADRRNDPEAAAVEGLLQAVRDLLDAATVDALFAAAEDDFEVKALFARTQPARNFDHDREEWIDREMRAMSADVGRDGERIDDVAERRGANDKDGLILRRAAHRTSARESK